jgi:O-antigen/teichoic acid export membrane protein
LASVKSLAKDTIIYGISHIFPRLINFLFVTAYLTRTFSESEYGRYVEIYAYLTLILGIITFRMDTAYFRFASNKSKEEKDKVYITLLVPILILTGLALLFIFVRTDYLVKITQLDNAGKVIQWMAVVMGLDAFTTNIYSKYRLDGRPLKFMTLKIINVVLLVGLMVFFTSVMHQYLPSFANWMDDILSINSKIEYAYFANLVASVVVFLLVLPDIIKVKFGFDKPLLIKALQYSWPLTVIAAAAAFNSYYTTPLVKFMSGGGKGGETAAGIFSAGLKLSILLNLFSTAYNYAAEPFFFNNNNKENDKTIFGKAALAFTLFSCFAVIGIYAYIDIIKEILGEKVQPGIIVMPLLLMANVFLGLYYNVSMWYKLSDNTRIGLFISLMGMGITYGVCYILIPRIGIMGAAWATFLCYLTMLITSYYQGQKHYPLVYPVKKIVTFIFGTSCVLLLFWLMREKWEVSIWIRVTFNTIVLGAFSYYLYMTELKNYVPAMKKMVLSKLKS